MHDIAAAASINHSPSKLTGSTSPSSQLSSAAIFSPHSRCSFSSFHPKKHKRMANSLSREQCPLSMHRRSAMNVPC